jgi:hypothetical protein
MMQFTETGVPVPPLLTPEEEERALAALARMRQSREALLKERGGRLYRPAWEDLEELREERERELP